MIRSTHLHCIGGNQTQFLNALCAEGFEGILCGKCEDPSTSYFSWPSISCQDCSDFAYVWKALLIIPILLLLPIALWRELGQRHKQQAVTSIQSEREEMKSPDNFNCDCQPMKHLNELYCEFGYFQKIAMIKLTISSLQVDCPCLSCTSALH
jgi:hypothetical protein